MYRGGEVVGGSVGVLGPCPRLASKHRQANTNTCIPSGRLGGLNS